MTFIYFFISYAIFMQLFLVFFLFFLVVCVCFALNNRLLRVPVLQANISSVIKTFFTFNIYFLLYFLLYLRACEGCFLYAADSAATWPRPLLSSLRFFCFLSLFRPLFFEEQNNRVFLSKRGKLMGNGSSRLLRKVIS